mgnify:FL=1
MMPSWASSMRVVKQGAESFVLEGSFLGMKAIFKLRVPKAYMDPSLDRSLRFERTMKEAKVLATAYRAGVNVPRVLAVYPSMGLIVMELIEGPTLKEVIDTGGPWRDLAVEAGRQVGLLHRAGIVHGDSTTSNMIVRGGAVYLIDFGLADFSISPEDRAVDVHLLREAVTSTHPSIAEELYSLFLKGYESALGHEAAKVVAERARAVEMRGRYVASRRTVWRG